MQNIFQNKIVGVLLVLFTAVLALSVLTFIGGKFGVNAEVESSTRVEVAIFAGGCFWCMQHPFDSLEGVISTTVGYSGGHVDDPTYMAVSKGATGHREVIEVRYDPAKVGYERLLDVFWRNIDPHDGGGQFCDRGEQYSSAIFVMDERQKNIAINSREQLRSSGKLKEPVVTKILPSAKFYPAEDYHQGYYRKHQFRYKFYRAKCGRDSRLKEIWGGQ
jgi:peptide-methionine (S)-S-oxide reductase